jgi:sigma-B regulation protein RsbU (phosphoserine phosphatase)
MAARLLDDPLAALEQLNEALCERSPLSLVSLCCAHLTQSAGGARAQVLLAGHPPALHVRAEEVAAVGRPARLLGLPGSGRWAPVEVTLEPGDLLVFYTDGVVDTFGESERFGEDRLAETVRGARDAGGAVARIDGALSAFGRGLQRDDTAVLAVERRVSD